ncbi:hypothetical protein U14_05929 [Candidatus Moduliflexus flocculans]|uniref:DUF4350 domain-containing protein n=1 Tax=Candidatus Moduliflexus flocculans TaxID=1499966 RepID=A0A081BTB1_9BACT|nr:hypothetical protein U14_05929 [Candidatus Moduliflexus flocculans]
MNEGNARHMKKRPIGIYLLAGVAVSLFVFGVLRLFILRYEAGDFYPPYSSLRTDPLGAKALYEGLDRLDELSCSRNYQPFTKLTELRQATIFYLGLNFRRFQSEADREAVIAAEQILLNGGRLVVSFLPENNQPQATFFGSDNEETESEDDTNDEKKEQKSDDEKAGQSDETTLLNLAERWGVKFEVAALPNPSTEKDAAPIFARRADQQEMHLPDTLSWHTGLYFTPIKNDWRVIYRRDSHPVIIERDYGNGTIVLSADSYFLSNEAMRSERHADLLAWLVGRHSHVLFDETHFGVITSPGVASLIRKYGLSGFFISLFVLALLFIWQNSVSFVPPQKEHFAEGGAVGKDMMAGLVNLLRSNIAPRDILSTCLAEWEKTCTHLPQDDPAIWEQITAAIQAEEARPFKERQPLELYHTIARILAGR